jgi:hypothetical protein
VNTGAAWLYEHTFVLRGDRKGRREEDFLLCVLGVLSGFFPIVVTAAPPVRTMYNDALAREQIVRAALSAADATPAVLADVRAAAAGYEAVVRQYPASAYSDNALWQGGRLLLDAFSRFGQAADKDAGIKMLKRLAVMYPTSKLARQVPEQLTRRTATIRCPKTSSRRTHRRSLRGRAARPARHPRRPTLRRRVKRRPPPRCLRPASRRSRASAGSCCGHRADHDRARQRGAVP